MTDARLVSDAAVEVKGRVVRSHMEGDVRVIDELRIESASFVPYLKDDAHVFVPAAAPAEGLHGHFGMDGLHAHDDDWVHEPAEGLRACEKCGYTDLGVSYHGPQRSCHPLGSNDPCWSWHDKEHLSINCRRCGFRRTEAALARHESAGERLMEVSLVDDPPFGPMTVKKDQP